MPGQHIEINSLSANKNIPINRVTIGTILSSLIRYEVMLESDTKAREY